MYKKLALVPLLLMAGCATITRGTTEVLVIESAPPGAAVTLQPASIKCTTPCSLKLKRKGNYNLTIEKAGYEPTHLQVLSQVAGAGAAGMAGNVILGGLIGAAVDAGTGATKQLVPNPVRVNLVPTAQSSAPPIDPLVSWQSSQ